MLRLYSKMEGRKMSQDRTIYAKLFGHFHLLWGEEEVSLGKNSSTRYLKLLQIMLAHKDKGISRSLLLEYLYGKEEIANISNNLRVTMYRLRRQLQEAGLPKSEYFVLESSSMTYRWDPNIQVMTDAEVFDAKLKAARSTKETDEKIRLLEEACALYHGEFLEDIGLEEWVIVQAVQYKEKYEKALRQLLRLLKERKEYERMLELCGKASRLYPYDEWQEEQLECLIAMDRFEEAFGVYEETSRMYFDELGISVSPRMLEQFGRLRGKVKNAPQAADEIQKQIMEKQKESGALYMSLPSFIDTYRLVERMTERNGQSIYLMVCTLQNSSGQQRSGRKISEKAEWLKEVIKSSLRRGDTYTRYSDTQYLVLLSGTNRENCDKIFDRIKRRFGENHRSWNQDLDFYAVSVSNMEQGGGRIRFRNNSFQIHHS